MSQKKVKLLLDKLTSELETTKINAETRDMLQTLESDIHVLLDEESEEDNPASLMETAELLEARFASEHPIAGGFLRELIDALARMGV